MNRGKIQGYAQQGGGTVTISGAGTASIKVEQSFISCTVTVYNTGTVTLATLYSDATGTAKAHQPHPELRGAGKAAGYEAWTPEG